VKEYPYHTLFEGHFRLPATVLGWFRSLRNQFVWCSSTEAALSCTDVLMYAMQCINVINRPTCRLSPCWHTCTLSVHCKATINLLMNGNIIYYLLALSALKRGDHFWSTINVWSTKWTLFAYHVNLTVCNAEKLQCKLPGMLGLGLDINFV